MISNYRVRVEGSPPTCLIRPHAICAGPHAIPERNDVWRRIIQLISEALREKKKKRIFGMIDQYTGPIYARVFRNNRCDHTTVISFSTTHADRRRLGQKRGWTAPLCPSTANLKHGGVCHASVVNVMRCFSLMTRSRACLPFPFSDPPKTPSQCHRNRRNHCPWASACLAFTRPRAVE